MELEATRVPLVASARSLDKENEMNEYQFTKACIKVFGLILLLLGLTGLIANAANTGLAYIQIRKVVNAETVSDTSRMNTMIQSTLKRSMTAQASRMVGDIVKIGVGLFLCRRYRGLVKWVVKDDPTIGVP